MAAADMPAAGLSENIELLGGKLATSKACTDTPHTLTWVPPLAGGAHWRVLTTLLLAPLILRQVSLHYMHSYDVISPTPL